MRKKRVFKENLSGTNSEKATQTNEPVFGNLCLLLIWPNEKLEGSGMTISPTLALAVNVRFWPPVLRLTLFGAAKFICTDFLFLRYVYFKTIFNYTKH